MSRQKVLLDDNRLVLVGYDRPFRTLFAMLYDPLNDGTRDEDEPDKTVGYHPTEQALAPNAEHGPYPADWAELDAALIAWGLSGEERDRVGAALAKDVDYEASFQ